MAYAVKQEGFEGPLDLLLTLVSKERVDIADISISKITEEYLAAVRDLDPMSLNEASAFLVLAATLLELKSIKLLPKGAVDAEVALLLEERDRLLHRLIEYASFKAAAGAISEMLEGSSGIFNRLAPLPSELARLQPDVEIDRDEFFQSVREALGPKPSPQVDLSHVTPIRVSVAEMTAKLVEAFATRKAVSFRELVGPSASRLEVVVAFLAILEMFKGRSLEIEQERPLGEMMLRPRNPVGHERSVGARDG